MDIISRNQDGLPVLENQNIERVAEQFDCLVEDELLFGAPFEAQ